MDRLGPFEPRPILAVAVSGGADSLALAILANRWAGRQNGSIIALVVDHGLRPASADEARITVERLAGIGIRARLLLLSDLARGPALAERARIARYAILAEACRDVGSVHLLLGHHAADQVETLVMRVLRGSGTHGLAGMAALRETAGLRLLRPLLDIDPTRLRHFLTASGVDWIEDPSNQDASALRPRLRQRLAGQAPEATGLPAAMASVGRLRSREEAGIASVLAKRAAIRPEGFALLSSGRIDAAALSALVRTIAGLAYPPNAGQIADWAAEPRPATVAGVRMMPAGRLGDGWLVVREEAAIMAPVQATHGVVWDNRFRLSGARGNPNKITAGKLGSDSVRFRRDSDLPSAVLRTLPALRSGGRVIAVPHLGYAADAECPFTVLFAPPQPAAGPCFVAARQANSG